MKKTWVAGLLLTLILVAVNAGADQFVTSMKIYLQQSVPLYDKAIEQGEEGLKDPGAAKNWELHSLLAECYASVSRYEEAGKQYQEAISLNPAKKEIILKGDGKYIAGRDSKWSLALYNGADLRMKSGLDTISASQLALSEDMKKLIKEEGQPEAIRQGTYKGKPIVVFTYWTKGEDFKFLEGRQGPRMTLRNPSIKDYSKLAIAELKGAITLDPENAQAYEQLAALYNQMGRRDEMIAMLQEAIKGDSTNAVLHVSLGTAYENDRKYDLAIPEFKRATVLSDTLFRGWAGLGESHLNLKHYVEAAEAFKRAATLDTLDKNIYYNLGLAYSNLKDSLNSLKAFKQVVALDPTDCEAWLFVGDNSGKMKDDKGAIEAYEKALKLNCSFTRENSYLVWQNLCVLYNRNNMKDKAEGACKKAAELNPKK